MIKHIKKYWVMFITYYLMSIAFLITLVSVLMLTNGMNKYFSFYSPETIKFAITESKQPIFLSDVLNCMRISDKNEFLLVQMRQPYDEDIYPVGFYSGEKSEIKLSLDSGRNITQEEFIGEEKVAVVKKNVYDSLDKVNGEAFLNYYGENYKVVGILDSSKNEYYNDIYISIFSIENNPQINQEAIGPEFKYDKSNNTDEGFKDFQLSLKEKFPDTTISYDKFISTANPLKLSLNANKILIISLILLLCVLFITVINIVSYWIDNEKLELGIRKLLGATNKSLICLLFKRYFVVLLISILMGNITFEIIKNSKIFDIFYIAKSNLVIDFISTILVIIVIEILSLLTLIKPISKICRINVNEVIRGNE